MLLTVQQCPDPGEIVNGARSVRPEAGFAVGTVVRFSCNQGYQLEGPSQISCHGRDTGTPKWSDRSPKCVCESRSLYFTLSLNVLSWTAIVPFSLLQINIALLYWKSLILQTCQPVCILHSWHKTKYAKSSWSQCCFMLAAVSTCSGRGWAACTALVRSCHLPVNQHIA